MKTREEWTKKYFEGIARGAFEITAHFENNHFHKEGPIKLGAQVGSTLHADRWPPVTAKGQ